MKKKTKSEIWDNPPYEFGVYDNCRQQIFVHKSGRFTLILIEIENSLYYLVDVPKRVHPRIESIKKNWIYLGDL